MTSLSKMSRVALKAAAGLAALSASTAAQSVVLLTFHVSVYAPTNRWVSLVEGTNGCVMSGCITESTTIEYHQRALFIAAETADLPAGWSYSFQEGMMYSAMGDWSGQIVSLGNGAFTGLNLYVVYSSGHCGPRGGCSVTQVRAPTFTVRLLSPTPVPEPATWALMLTGFGAVGWSMRSRTRQRLIEVRYAA